MKKIYSIIICLALLFSSLPQAPAAFAAASDDNKLSSLSVESMVYEDGAEHLITCGIYPEFSSEQTEGVVDVAYGVKEVRITAQPSSSTANLEISGEPATAGVATTVYGMDLAVGDNPIPVKVTPESGSERIYTLHVKRVSDQYALPALPQTPEAYQASQYADYARRLATGSQHSLALKKDGTVVAWGDTFYGQCNIPYGLDNVIALSAGGQFSLALKKDGTVVAWGINSFGQCDVPAGLSNVVDISAGGSFSAALDKSGRIVVWGDNSYGQCDIPAGLNEASDVVDIQCGRTCILALKKDGTMVAWGNNTYGQCNLPDGLNNVVSMAAGWTQIMALQNDGTLLVWGKDTQGNDFKNLKLQYVKAIAAGSYHSVALKWDGSMAVWGNWCGQNVDFAVPLELNQVQAISSNYEHLLALHENGTVTAWQTDGSIDYGQCDVPQGLNLFAEDSSYSGPAPAIPQTPAAYAASEYARTAAKICVMGEDDFAVLNMDGTVKVMISGEDRYGLANVPTGLSNVKAIAATLRFIMALKEDGTVTVWGISAEDIPESVKDVKAIAAANQYCLALKEDGTVVAWGSNDSGQCDVPKDLSGVKSIAAGYYHCLALKEDGTVVAWGKNSQGQCDVPAGLNNVSRVYAGADHSVALKNDGTVVAWGNNDKGQCDLPANLSNVVDVFVKSYYNVALKGNGTVVVWGDNYYGKRNVPPGLHDVASVTICDGIYAVKTDGTIIAWGYNPHTNVEELTSLTNVLTVSNYIVIFRDGTLECFGDNSSSIEQINEMLSKAGINVLSGHYFATNSVELLNPSGESIASVAGQSGYRIKANIANNYCSSKEGLVIVQVRSGTGATSTGGGQVLGCIGLAGKVPVEGKTVSTDFTMPENLSGQAYVDVFVWDGWNTMVPRAEANQSLSFDITE